MCRRDRASASARSLCKIPSGLSSSDGFQFFHYLYWLYCLFWLYWLWLFHLFPYASTSLPLLVKLGRLMRSPVRQCMSLILGCLNQMQNSRITGHPCLAPHVVSTSIHVPSMLYRSKARSEDLQLMDAEQRILRWGPQD